VGHEAVTSSLFCPLSAFQKQAASSEWNESSSSTLLTTSAVGSAGATVRQPKPREMDVPDSALPHAPTIDQCSNEPRSSEQLQPPMPSHAHMHS